MKGAPSGRAADGLGRCLKLLHRTATRERCPLSRLHLLPKQSPASQPVQATQGPPLASSPSAARPWAMDPATSGVPRMSDKSSLVSQLLPRKLMLVLVSRLPPGGGVAL